MAELIDRLKLDPTLGSRDRAHDFISSFHHQARTLAHACRVVAVDLGWQPQKAGRPRLDWYDDFTKLLLDVAKRAGVRPALQKNRITGARAGWLLDAALALERFFYPGMESGTAETCGKRLERSLQRLKAVKTTK